jgi:ketosteroid isomerase-like protein
MLKLAILAALASMQTPAPDTAQDHDRNELERLNMTWLKSYETRDRAALGQVLAPDFIGLYGDSVLSRQQMLDGLATRPQTRVKWENLRISIRGDTAVVDAISTITTVRDRAQASASYHYVDVYSRRKNEWRAIASHVVRLDD